MIEISMSDMGKVFFSEPKTMQLSQDYLYAESNNINWPQLVEMCLTQDGQNLFNIRSKKAAQQTANAFDKKREQNPGAVDILNEMETSSNNWNNAGIFCAIVPHLHVNIYSEDITMKGDIA